MNIVFSRTFIKQIKNLKPAQQKRLRETMQLFRIDPFNPRLYNHSLTGEWASYRSISFGGDWRAHYKLLDTDTAHFDVLGSHSQLYR